MEKKTKRIVIVAVITAIALIAAVIGVTAWYNAPTQRINRMLDLGQEYLLAEDYEEAITAYTDILKIDPKNEDAVGGAVKAYAGLADKLYAQEKYEEAVATLEEAKEILPDNEAINIKEADIYLGWAKTFSDRDEYSKAIDILEEGYEQTNDIRLRQEISHLDELLNSQEEIQVEAEPEIEIEVEEEEEIQNEADEAVVDMSLVEVPITITSASIEEDAGGNQGAIGMMTIMFSYSASETYDIMIASWSEENIYDSSRINEEAYEYQNIWKDSPFYGSDSHSGGVGFPIFEGDMNKTFNVLLLARNSDKKVVGYKVVSVTVQ